MARFTGDTSNDQRAPDADGRADTARLLIAAIDGETAASWSSIPTFGPG
jgi:hypothetical protein